MRSVEMRPARDGANADDSIIVALGGNVAPEGDQGDRSGSTERPLPFQPSSRTARHEPIRDPADGPVQLGPGVPLRCGRDDGAFNAGVAKTLQRALLAFPDVGIEVVRRSRLWRSAAWPDPSDPPFLNAVAIVQTPLAPRALLDALHRLEARFGRVHGEPNAPRTLDLDLIAYGRRVRDTAPTLPHPRAAERRFVMGPLAELLPEWRHPVSGERAADLVRRTAIGREAVPAWEPRSPDENDQ